MQSSEKKFRPWATLLPLLLAACATDASLQGADAGADGAGANSGETWIGTVALPLRQALPPGKAAPVRLARQVRSAPAQAVDPDLAVTAVDGLAQALVDRGEPLALAGEVAWVAVQAQAEAVVQALGQPLQGLQGPWAEARDPQANLDVLFEVLGSAAGEVAIRHAAFELQKAAAISRAIDAVCGSEGQEPCEGGQSQY